MKKFLLGTAIAAGCVVFGASDAGASSHREAPFVTRHPKIDSTDFYMFMSYDSTSPAVGGAGYVTILANYQPFQENFGGPNYYELDPDALYEISIDNNGDGKEDITYQFNFHHALANGGNGLTLTGYTGGGAGSPNAPTTPNDVPLINIGGISAASTSALNVNESYDLTVVAGDRRTGTASPVFQNQTKPVDFIGTATFGSASAYEAYAKSYIKSFTVPGCTTTKQANAWVGQRREGFAGNIGVIFDLVQANPVEPAFASAITSGTSSLNRGFTSGNPFNTGLLYNKNVTTIALEIPKECLVDATNTGPTAGIIGGWTSASMHQARVLNPAANYTVPSKEGGAWTQVSHLGMPLVNEVVIGLKDKDTFSAVSPVSTSAVAAYVTNPTLPAIIEVLYSAANPKIVAPTQVRSDLVATFATGLTLPKSDGSGDLVFTQTSSFTAAGIPAPTGATIPDGVYEYLRLNTGVPASSKTTQEAIDDSVKGLGAVGCLQYSTDGKTLQVNTGATNATTSKPLCDAAGFPNGRRPGDDVVDIALRVVMGALIPDPTVAPAQGIAFTDVNYNGPEQFDETFPYLRTPLAGNVDPNQTAATISQQ